jgi:hypothetical protein
VSIGLSSVCIPFVIKYVCHTVITEFVCCLATLWAPNYIEKCTLGYLRKFLSAKGYQRKGLGTSSLVTDKALYNKLPKEAVNRVQILLVLLLLSRTSWRFLPVCTSLLQSFSSLGSRILFALDPRPKKPYLPLFLKTNSQFSLVLTVEYLLRNEKVL